MKITEFKNQLSKLDKIEFRLEDQIVPEHFHITEVGVINKEFIDCGGTARKENFVTFQLWIAEDTEHRLKPEKLLNIISIAEKTIPIDNFEVEVEYQTSTIGKYGLEFDETFRLINKKTDCLAKDICILTVDGPFTEGDCCSGSSGCCDNNG